MNHLNHPPVRTRKPRGQGAARQAEILAAAKRLFVEEGVPEVTMRRIAAEVGVSATALYVYFPDKDAILQAIAEEHFAALLVVLEAANDPRRPAMENLRAGLRAYCDFALSRPDEYRLTFLRQGRRGEPDPCADITEADMTFAILQNGVEAMIAEGHYPDKSSSLMAEALWACVHGAMAVLLTMPEVVESDPAALTDLVIDMAVKGLCKK